MKGQSVMLSKYARLYNPASPAGIPATTAPSPAQPAPEVVVDGQLTLFVTTDKADIPFFTPNKRMNAANELIGLSLQIKKRADLAKSLGLNPRKQSARLDAAILAATDKAKVVQGQEMVAMVASPRFTAHSTPITTRKLKNGQRVTMFKLVTVDRDLPAKGLSAEAIAEATGQPVEQVRAQMAKTASAKPVDVSATVTTAATAPAPEKPVAAQPAANNGQPRK